MFWSLLSANNTFVIQQYSTDKSMGTTKIILLIFFFNNTANETINQERFLNALAGPKVKK
jgi:hypothetical protein